MMVRGAEAICLGNLVEVVLGHFLLFRTHSLHQPVLHLLLVMDLEHSRQVLMADPETVFRILQVQGAVPVMVRDRHTPAQKDFSRIQQAHRVHHFGQGVLLVGMGCHSPEVGVHVLLSLRPSALLPFHSHPSLACLVRLSRSLLADILLLLYRRENLGDPSHLLCKDLSSLAARIRFCCSPQVALVQTHSRVVEVCHIHLVHHNLHL